MNEKSFITATELAAILEVSQGYAYKLIHKFNEDLKAQGYLTFAGRVPKKYLEDHCYGYEAEVDDK